MSLVTQIAALASRIASEFVAVRSEISSLPSGDVEFGTSFPSSPRKGQMFFMDDEQVAYIYGGTNWIPMMTVFTVDGGPASQDEDTVLMDGGDSELSSPYAISDAGDA